MPDSSIAAGFARALLDLAVSKGASRKELAARSGIDLKQLQDQDSRIPFAKYIALMRAAKELANDPALALHFGEAFDMSELSIVGLLAQAADSAADAVQHLGRYNRLIADVEVDGPPDGERLMLSREHGQLWLVDRRKNPNDFPEITESGFARMASMTRRFGTAQYMLEVHVTHKAPSYRAEYDRIFQVPVHFESERNALLIDEKVFAYTPMQPSRYVFGILSQRADALLRSLENAKTTRGRVEGLLIPILHTGRANVDVIASQMAVSRQTLFRKLKAEGTSFEKVLDELRCQLALHYLSENKVSVNETAYLVGFSEAAAFSRAFKRWTGSSPRAMRDSKIENAKTARRLE